MNDLFSSPPQVFPLSFILATSTSPEVLVHSQQSKRGWEMSLWWPLCFKQHYHPDMCFCGFGFFTTSEASKLWDWHVLTDWAAESIYVKRWDGEARGAPPLQWGNYDIIKPTFLKFKLMVFLPGLAWYIVMIHGRYTCLLSNKCKDQGSWDNVSSW